MPKNKKEKIVIIIFIILLIIGGFASFTIAKNAKKAQKEAQEKLSKLITERGLAEQYLTEQDLCFQITNRLAGETCDKILDLSSENCLGNLDNLLCRKFLGAKMISEIPKIKNKQENDFKKICKELFSNPHPDEESPAFSEVEVNEFCNQMVILLNKKDKNLCQFVFTKFTKKDEKNIRSCEIWADPSPELCKDIENPALLSNCLGKVWTTKSFYENKPDYCKEIANYEYRSLCLFFHNKLNTEKCSVIYSGKENFFKIEANRVYCQ